MINIKHFVRFAVIGLMVVFGNNLFSMQPRPLSPGALEEMMMLSESRETKGTVVIFTGTSSSGKTTLIEKIKEFGFFEDWRPMALDAISHKDYVVYDDYYAELQEDLKKFSANRQHTANAHAEKAGLSVENYALLQTIKESLDEDTTGESKILCDTVIFDNYELTAVKRILTSFGLNVKIVLVYCPLPELCERVLSRNSKKSQNSESDTDEDDGERSPVAVVTQFANIYTPTRSPITGPAISPILSSSFSERPVDNIDRRKYEEQMTSIFSELATRESTSAMGNFKPVASMGVAPTHGLTETPIYSTMAYDLIVDTSKQSFEGITQRIIELIQAPTRSE